jgi:transposase-like protein/DDE family transposase
MYSTRNWAAEEFGGTDLGDVRRTRRLVTLAAEIAAKPAGTVTRACTTSASREGAFRLLENPTVHAEALRRSVQDATARRCRGQAVVFVPMDGSSLQITDEKRSKGIGAIGAHRKGARGVLSMTALAVGHDGCPLGILGQQFWIRRQRSQRNDARGAPRLGGESMFWLAALEQCDAALGRRTPEVKPWYQIDRGGDCWQVLTYADEAGVLLTVRAVHDRRLDDRIDRLWEAVEQAPIKATKWIDVPARARTRRSKRLPGRQRIHEHVPARQARRAKLTIRAATVALRIRTPNGVTTADFNAVFVRERKKAKERIEWLLLTTHSIRTRAEVLEVVRGYSLRWRVEDFHRAWKSGLCRVEDTQLRSREAIYKWATLLAAVATRAMRLTHQARSTPDVPATTELTALELEALIALRQPSDVGDRVPTLAEAVRWLAEIGGYTGPWNGPPGATVVGRGLHDLLVAARAFASRDKKR